MFNEPAITWWEIGSMGAVTEGCLISKLKILESSLKSKYRFDTQIRNSGYLQGCSEG